MFVSALPAMRSRSLCSWRAEPSRPTCSFATVTLSPAEEQIDQVSIFKAHRIKPISKRPARTLYRQLLCKIISPSESSLSDKEVSEAVSNPLKGSAHHIAKERPELTAANCCGAIAKAAPDDRVGDGRKGSQDKDVEEAASATGYHRCTIAIAAIHGPPIPAKGVDAY